MLTLRQLQSMRAALADEATTIFERVAKDERTLTDEERARLDAVEAETRKLDEDIARLQRHEERLAALAASAKDTKPSGGAESKDSQSEPSEPVYQDWDLMTADERRDYQRDLRRRGAYVGRIIRALAAGKGDLERAKQFARKWGEDDVVYRALSASDFAAGGALVPPEWSAAIIELLRARAVVRRMNPTIVAMERGTLQVPKITGGATAAYIGENQPITKSTQALGQLVLTFRKLACLVPISNDLIRFATPNADGIVRDDLVGAIATRSDLAFIRGDGAQNTPKGLRYWAPSGNVIAANTTVNLANVTADLGKLWLALANANVPFLRPGWLVSARTWNYLASVRDANGNFAFRDELLRGQLLGFPIAWTTQIPNNLGSGADESEVYLADFADVVIGESTGLLIDASTEAAYDDGGTVRAAYSLDQTVIRAITEHDFGMRHNESVAVLTGVKWI